MRSYPAFFLISATLKYWIAVGFSALLLGTTLVNAAPEGFLIGHLTIASGTPVQRDDEKSDKQSAAGAVMGGTYADYPLVVLTRGERKPVARITADAKGDYRAALSPGDYILDVEGRVPRRLRVRAQPFTITPSETVHVDLTILTGFGEEGSRRQE